MPPSLRNRIPRTCYGCKQLGHILRDCPEKQKYIGRLRRLHEIGSGAHLILSDCDQDPSAEMDEVVHFLEDACDLPASNSLCSYRTLASCGCGRALNLSLIAAILFSEKGNGAKLA